MPYSTSQIRNVALAGHPGAGKTTLFEALLHAGGAITTAGSIERCNTVSDFDPMEKERGHSMDAAIASVDYTSSDGSRIHLNLFDLPGYPDFRGPALAALAAADSVAIVVDAGSGVEHGARRLMARAAERGLSRIVVVNKIDQEGADPARVLVDLREAFGPEVLPLNLSADGGARIVGCFPGCEGGSADAGDVKEWHRQVVDQVVEINETVMDHYLERGEDGVAAGELHDAFEQCLREGHLVPVCFVSARSGTGIQALLDIIANWLPHPGEVNPPPFAKGGGDAAQPIVTTADADAHVVADVFKIVNDPFVGKLGVFRVYQGSIRKDMTLFVDDGRKPFKVGHLLRPQGKDYIEIEQAIAGDIAAVAKIDGLHFDAVLHDSHDEDQIHLEPMAFPKPMFGLAIEAASRGQEQKLSNALHKLHEEDPCFQVDHADETNETVIHGLSDLHLRVMLQRLKDRHGVEVSTRPPRVAYRETISGHAEGHYRHKKQTGGAGQFGEVFLRVDPMPRGSGFEFVDQVKGGTIPGQFLPAVEKGVRQVLASGAIAGFPIQDIQVTVYDGKHHPVDSKEVAFITAGKKAFLDAINKAGARVLEPIVELEVAAPEQHMGDISAGLASKRARINGTDAVLNEVVIKAQVPLSELEGYAAELKSVTAGRGRYAIDFSHYEAVPDQVQQRLVEAYKPQAEDD